MLSWRQPGGRFRRALLGRRAKGKSHAAECRAPVSHTEPSERMSLNRPNPGMQDRPPRPRPLPAAVLALALAGLAGCSGLGSHGASAPLPGDAPTPTADAAVRSTPVVPGRPARVFIFAGFGKQCEPVAAPQITITEPPAKGDVSFVPGQETTIQYSAQGTCIGQKTQGTGIYYTARAGQEGADRFSIAAKLGKISISRC
jgi:hypothetical protein